MPNIVASSPNGRLTSANIKKSVVVPPPIIDTIAAFELGFLEKYANNVGTRRPETINEYDFNTIVNTEVNQVARKNATTPRSRVAICDVANKLRVTYFFKKVLSKISFTKLPEAAIRQLSAVDITAEK